VVTVDSTDYFGLNSRALDGGENCVLSEAYLQRFGGVARLYGRRALEQLAAAHFCVIGIGGVGSWVAEALVRTGLGEITLVDMDEICITNSNRQIHALQSSIGQSKIEVMAARLLQINPELIVHKVDDFADIDNLETIISPDHNMVIDAIDSAKVKSALIAYCRRRKMQIITIGSAGGKVDPRRIVSGDLSKTIKDPLLSRVRKQLRQQYGFPRGPKKVFSVEAVYSPEQMLYPDGQGGVCSNKPDGEAAVNLDCSGGFGSVTMVTAGFAMTASTRAIARYLERAG